jgi:superfamily II DNA helicase RecQ
MRVAETSHCSPLSHAAACQAVVPSPPVLLAHPTGSGKSSVRDVCSIMCAGFSLTIVPLLLLGTDQEEKLTLKAKRTEGTIMSVHLDKICLAADQEQLIMKLKLLPNDCSATVVLFMSPQAMLNLEQQGRQT